MSELQAEHYEINEAALQGQDAPAARRSSFVPLENAPVFSERAKAPQASMFDPFNQHDPFSATYGEFLITGYAVKVPVPAYDEDDNKIPNTVRFEELTVGKIDNRGHRPVASLLDDGGFEVYTIESDILTKRRDAFNAFEARIARELLIKDGLNLQDPALKVIYDKEDSKEIE